MIAQYQAFLRETTLSSSLQAASSAISGLSQGTNKQEKPSANITANPMAQESYGLYYVVLLLLLCCFPPACLLRKSGNPTQR